MTHRITRAHQFRRLAALETDEHVLWPYAKTGVGYGELWIDGGMRSTHALALARRIPKPKALLYACHQPGCPRLCLNYRHLRWATPVENMVDKLLDDTHNRGERHWRHILSEVEVREMRVLRASSCLSYAAIGRRYGVSSTTVFEAVRGDTWGWLE